MSKSTIILDGSHSYLRRSELLKKKNTTSHRRPQTSTADKSGNETTTALAVLDDNSHHSVSYCSQTPSVIFESGVGEKEWDKITGRSSKHRSEKLSPVVSKSFTEAIREQRASIENGKLSLVNSSVAAIDMVSSVYATRIHTLYMSGNLLRSVQGIEQFANIELLSLANCEIRYMDELRPLSRLQHLQKLSLEGNPVTTIAYYRLRVLALCSRLFVLDSIKVLHEERNNMISMDRVVQSQLDLLRTGELKLTVLRHMASLIACHAQLVATVLGRFRCLRGQHVGMSESFDGPLRIVSHAGEGGRLGDVANTIRIALSGGVFRSLQMCDVDGSNLFERRVDDICRRLHSAAMRKLPAATRAKTNKALWDDLCGLCAQHHQKQSIALTEACERSREALLCEYNKESVRQSREKPLDAMPASGAVISSTLNMLDRLRFEGSYCGIGPHEHAPMPRAQFVQLYQSIIPPPPPPPVTHSSSSPDRRSRSVSPQPRRPPPHTPWSTSESPRRKTVATTENRSPNRDSVQDRYMTILKSVCHKDGAKKKSSVLLSAKKLSFALPEKESVDEGLPSAAVSRPPTGEAESLPLSASPNDNINDFVIAYDYSFVSDTPDDPFVTPPPAPEDAAEGESLRSEAEDVDPSHQGWEYLNSLEVSNFLSLLFSELPLSWSDSLWQVDDLVPSSWLAKSVAAKDVLGNPPLVWEAPFVASTASTPKQLQKLVDSAISDLQRVVTAISVNQHSNAELSKGSLLLRKRLIAHAAAATRGLEEAKQRVAEEATLNSKAKTWIQAANTLVHELCAFKDETARQQDRITNAKSATVDLHRAREIEDARKVKISTMLEEVIAAVAGIRHEMENNAALRSSAHHQRNILLAEEYSMTLRSPLIIYMRELRFRVRRQKKIKAFYQKGLRISNAKLLRICFNALSLYTTYNQHLMRAAQWLRKCRTQRWWCRWRQCCTHSRVVTVHQRQSVTKQITTLFQWWRRYALLSIMVTQSETIKRSKADRLRMSIIFRRWKALRASQIKTTLNFSLNIDSRDYYKAQVQFKRFRFKTWKHLSSLSRAVLEDHKYVLSSVRARDTIKSTWEQWRLTYKATRFWRLKQYKRVVQQFCFLWSRMRLRNRRVTHIRISGGMRTWHLMHAIKKWRDFRTRRARIQRAAGVVYQMRCIETLEYRWLQWRSAWIDSWSLRVKMHAAAKLYLRNLARTHFNMWSLYRAGNDDYCGTTKKLFRCNMSIADIENSSDSDDDSPLDKRHPVVQRLILQHTLAYWHQQSIRKRLLRRAEQAVTDRSFRERKRVIFGAMFAIWCRSVLSRVAGAERIRDGEKEITEIHTLVAEGVRTCQIELQEAEQTLDEERVTFAEQQEAVEAVDIEMSTLLDSINETVATIASTREREDTLQKEIASIYALCERSHDQAMNSLAPDAFRHLDEIRNEKIRLMESVEEGYRGAVRAAQKQLQERNKTMSSTDQAFAVAAEAKRVLCTLQAEMDVLEEQRSTAESVLLAAQAQLSNVIEKVEHKRIIASQREMEAAAAEDSLKRRLCAAEDEEATLLRTLDDLRSKDTKLHKTVKEQRPALDMAHDEMSFRNYVCNAKTSSDAISRSLTDLRVQSSESMVSAVRHSADYSRLLARGHNNSYVADAVNTGRRKLQQLRMEELNRLHTADAPRIKSPAERPPTPIFSDSGNSERSISSINSIPATDQGLGVSIQSLSSRIKERLSQPALIR